MRMLKGCVVVYKQLHTGFPEYGEAYLTLVGNIS
jgi:hypothetical protein